MRSKRNETAVDLVHCARCNFTSEDLGLHRCPRDGEVLGEIVVTCRRTSCLAVARRCLLTWAAGMAVLTAIWAAGAPAAVIVATTVAYGIAVLVVP